MLLFILGILAIVIGLAVRNVPSAYQHFAGRIMLAGGLLLVGGLLEASTVQIGPGQVGVQVLFGQVQRDVLSSGLHIINPLVDVERFDIRTQNYTMSATHTEGEVMGDDAIRVLSADGLEVVIDLTVLYHVNSPQAPYILKTIGDDYKNVIVRPVSRTSIRNNAANFDAVSLYSAKRNEFQQKVYADIEKDFNRNGLILDQLLVRNISLPDAVKNSIESKITAEQDAQKMQFVLQKEQQEAERKRIEAKGIADYQQILNSQLTDKLLQYEQIQAYKEISTSPNSKVIIMGKTNTPLMISDK
jgi:regulator of protease activity HflC (stomatin/prohibitin superfamily)